MVLGADLLLTTVSTMVLLHLDWCWCRWLGKTWRTGHLRGFTLGDEQRLSRGRKFHPVG